MGFKADKRVYIRRACFVLLIVLTAVFQHTQGAIVSVSGAKAFILIPMVVAVSMFNKSMAGLVFGVFAGVLWDFAAVRGDGFFSVALALTGYVTCLLMTYYMRNNIYSAMIISFGANLVINTAYWLIFILAKGYEGAAELFFRFYLPSAVYGAAFILVYYPVVSLVVKATAKEKILPKE